METQTLTPRPFTRPQDYYQLRDFGQKFEATIAFMKHHGGNLYRVLLAGLIPLLAGMVVLAVGASPVLKLMSPVPGRVTDPAELFGGGTGLAFGVAMLLMMTGGLLSLVLIYGFIKRRMESPDPTATISPAEAWAEVKSHVLPLLGVGLVLYVLVIIGFVLLFLPGMYLAIAFLLFPCVRIFENTGLSASVSRPLRLVQGKWWSTFGLLFVGSMAVGLVAGVLGGIVGVLVGAAAEGPFSLDSPGFAAYTLVRLIINFAATPVVYVLLAFQYFNLVERRDGVSLQWKIGQLGQQPTDAQPRSEDDALFRPSYGEQSH